MSISCFLNIHASFTLFQAAVEEGIVVGGGCSLLRLAAKVADIKDNLENDEQKVNMCSERKTLECINNF